MKKQKTHIRHHVGLILALVGLVSAATLMLASARLASAQTANPSWTYTGNLNLPRSRHTATLLQNGKVLVAGGFAAGGFALNSAELYDPATGVWSLTRTLNTARSLHTATLLRNGKALIVGGWDGSSVLNSAELYDPDTTTWTDTGKLNVARGSHTATLLSDGKVLVAGGEDPNGFFPAELYDPATGSWSITGSFGLYRLNHTATLLPDSRILVAGGYVDLIDEGLRSYGWYGSDLYDPGTTSWRRAGNLNTGRFNHTATLLPNGNVLVAGGMDENVLDNVTVFNSAELYDPATGTWSYTGSLNTQHAGHTATLLSNGQVLLAGGNSSAFNSAEIYDPVTGNWSTTASLNAPRSNHTATLLPNSKVLVVGGDHPGGPISSAELYDRGPGSTPNLIDDTQFFVRQHYRDFLNREPDADGLAFWTNEITSCGADQQCIEAKRINVSAAYFLSIEFQQTGYLVYRIYKASYGNLPGAPVPVRFNEFLPDTQRIAQGVIVNQSGWEQALENNQQAFISEFVQRSRFASTYLNAMTPAAFVDTLFANAGVTPADAERAAAIDEFSSAATISDASAQARALRRVAENSTLGQQEFNRAFVLMQYFGYLRRNPKDAPDSNFDGYNFWLNKLNRLNGNFVQAEMVKAFITADEYRRRFGP
jgi:hypothetical protein